MKIMSKEANNSLSETGPMSTTTAAVDYLMQTMPDFKEETPAQEEHSISDEQEGDDQDVRQEEIEPEYEAQADDDGEEYEAEAYEDESEDEEVQYVQIGDEELTLDEIEKGYLRQSDYTKKMQVLSKERQEAEKQNATYQQELAAIKAEREHLRTMLTQYDVKGNEPEIDWVELAENDPLEYTRQKAMHDARAKEREAAQAEQQRLQAIQNQEYQARFREFAEQQKAKVLEAIPEVKQNPKYMGQVETYMEGSGYSKEEIGKMFDARLVIMADKARKFDEMTGKTKRPASDKRVKPKGKVLRPSMQKTKTEKVSRQRNDARAKARKSGSVNDAVAALLS